MMQAAKNNEGKPQLHHILTAPRAVEMVCRVMEHGAEKYGKNNWKKGRPETEWVDAALRHIVSYLDEQFLDSESGLPELAHAAASILFALDQSMRSGDPRE